MVRQKFWVSEFTGLERVDWTTGVDYWTGVLEYWSLVGKVSR